MLSLRVEAEDTPLQQKLDLLADNIGKLGLGFAIATLSLLLVKYFVLLEGPFQFSHFFSHFVKYLITAITMVVVAVPEGLPLAVTLSLAYSMMKMLRDNNLVRHLAACETMGGATAVRFLFFSFFLPKCTHGQHDSSTPQVCSDKTGTLTQNRMTVVRGSVTGIEFGDKFEELKDLTEGSKSLLFQGVAMNSTAYEGPTPKGVEFLGNKTECALLGFTKKLGSQYKVPFSPSLILKNRIDTYLPPTIILSFIVHP